MNHLIIFLKNPEKGKVKTRLAATIGEDRALSIYEKLVGKTLAEALKVTAEVHLFFSDNAISTPGFSHIHQQKGEDLGERMKNAFEVVLRDGKSKAIIIGTDCPEINSVLLAEAFGSLDRTDLVIGPAADGGYYLLGMCQFFPRLFDGIAWSSSKVFEQTKKLSADNNLSFTELNILHDIDTEEDLKYLPEDF